MCPAKTAGPDSTKENVGLADPPPWKNTTDVPLTPRNSAVFKLAVKQERRQRYFFGGKPDTHSVHEHATSATEDKKKRACLTDKDAKAWPDSQG